MPVRASRRARTLPLTLLLAAVGLVPLVAACGDVSVPPDATPIAGVGAVTSQERQVDAFTRVSVGAAVTVVIGPADASKVTVAAAESLLPAVKTEVVDGQLVVTVPPPGVVAKSQITVTILGPAISSVAISSGATATLDTSINELRLDISGASRLVARGTAGELSLVANAAARIDLTALKVTNATVHLSDGAAATVDVSGSLGGRLEGGSNLLLMAAPASIQVETVSGSTVSGPN